MSREARAERQRRVVAECRAAMPALLENLWDTMLHAPDVAFPDVALELRTGLPDETARFQAVLAWLGHSEGECPVCHMLVARLPFTFPEPIAALTRALAASPAPSTLDGASRFLFAGLEARHALPAQVDRARLTELRAQADALPPELREPLRERWSSRRASESDRGNEETR